MQTRKLSSTRFLCSAAALAGGLGLGVLLLAEPVEGQSGTRSGSGSRGAQAPLDTRPFEAKFWDYLREVQYHNWAPGPGQGAGFYPGQSPHGAKLKVYLNRTAAADPARMPPGSVLIKENYGEDERLMAITVMYRAEGYDPEHNDWYWVKYLPDGRVDRTPPDMGSRPVAGRFAMCIECHAGAEGNDYAFINDRGGP